MEVLRVDRVKVIRELYFREDWSIRRISRELGHSRNTVRKAIRRSVDACSYELSTPRPRPVTSKIEGPIRELLEQERRDSPHRKQRLTAARIEQILRDEHGFTGGSSTVRKAVAEIRKELRDPLDGAMVPLAYEPGKDAQADFFHAEVIEPEGRVKRAFFILRSCYSALTYVYAAPGEAQEAFFEGLMRAFEFFDGVFHRIWFDNLTAAVRKVLRGRDRELQKAFEVFCAHYCFEARFCGKAKANEKGGVENAVGYVRRNALVPVPRVADRHELQIQLDEFMQRERSRTRRGDKRSIGERFSDETSQLIPLATPRFDAGRPRSRKASSTALVQDGRCFYSVPVQYANEQVMLKRYAEHVEIHHEPDGTIAYHDRLYGQEKTSFELEHYLALLHRKVRAFEHAAAVKAERASWPSCYETLLRVLRNRDGEAEGTRHFIKVLELHCRFDNHVVKQAVQQALSHAEPSLEMVRYYLDLAREAEQSVEPLSERHCENLPSIHVDAPDIAAYGALSSTRRV